MEAVGIGCIWFARRADDADDEIDVDQFVPSSHVADIRSALEGLDSVTNLEIEGNEDTLTEIWGLNDDTEDQTFFPIFATLVIRFDLLVPLRAHEKYLGSIRMEADVETFHVRIVYEGSMPVAYVHYTVPAGEDEVGNFSPAMAVVVVRKFLEEKLRNHPVVRFQLLGPSPCHVDVFVDTTTGPTDVSKDLTIIGGGYRTLYFSFAAKAPEELIDQLVSEHNEVLASFYMLVRLRNHARALREAVTDGALSLLQAPTRHGRWAAFQHWRGYRERIDAVFEALLHEKLNRVAQERHEADVRTDELVDSSSLFFAFLEREMGNPSKMPDEDIRELLIMLEERRRGYFENSATLVSGLVGGVLGATLGAFLTFGLGDRTPTKPVQATAEIKAQAPATAAAPSPTVAPTVPPASSPVPVVSPSTKTK